MNDRRGRGARDPKIQQRNSVAIAVMLILSTGGNSGASSVIADGKSMYPPSSDQIMAFASGIRLNRTMHTKGQANRAT